VNGLLWPPAGFWWVTSTVPPPASPRPPLSQVEHAFRWRDQLRFRLLRARLDLAGGEAEAARAGAQSLVEDAVSLGAGRCEVQARLVAAAAVAAGGAHRRPSRASDPFLAEVEQLLGRAAEVAGTESWWITGEVAHAFGITAWTELARQRVAELATRAGPYRDTLAAAAKRRGLG